MRSGLRTASRQDASTTTIPPIERYRLEAVGGEREFSLALPSHSFGKRLRRNVGHSHEFWIAARLEINEAEFEAARARSHPRHQATRWQSVTPIE